MFKFKIYPEIGNAYTITVPDITCYHVDPEDFVENWINENLNHVDHYEILEPDNQYSPNPFVYIELCEREVIELTFFETEKEAQHHLRNKFIEKIKEKDENFFDEITDKNCDYEDEWDEYGISTNAAWINDLPITHNNWDAYVLNLNETDSRSDILSHTIEKKYLFITSDQYQNLIKKAFGEKVATEQSPCGFGTAAVRNGTFVHIANSRETAKRISRYLSIKAVDVVPVTVNNKKGYSLICED